MNEQFQVCVIGCGDRGKAYAAAWQDRDDSTVASVFDPQEGRRLALAEKMEARPHDSYTGAIEQKGVNVVCVCTPVCFHSEITVCAAENGRHVLSEKPMALTLEQADDMIGACDANGVLLTLGLQRRTFYRDRKYKELFEAGEFGSPLFFRFQDMRDIRPKIAMHRRSQNNGPLVDMLCHYMDLARFVTGAEPVNVRAVGSCYAEDKPPVNDVPDPAIDAAAVMVEMTGGHVLEAFLNWGMRLGFPGSGQELVVGPEISAAPVPDGVEVQYADHSETWRDDGEGPVGAAGCVKWLVKAINGDAPLEVTGQDGRAALAVSLAALESIESGETVTL